MSTYNGSKYLSVQIDSILSQTYRDWHLYIRDDGSSDKTLEIVSHYCQSYPDKIFHIKDDIKHRGVTGSFMWLLDQVEADFYMFSDQDDFWGKKKIEICMNRMTELTKSYEEKALLVHTDLEVVDSHLITINQSLYKAINLYKIANKPEYLRCVNFVTGCTMMFNEKAKQVSVNVSKHAVMHDYWVAVCVLKDKGIISFIDETTIKYRQHANNVVGMKPPMSFVGRLCNIKKTFKNHKDCYTMLHENNDVNIFEYLYLRMKKGFHVF